MENKNGYIGKISHTGVQVVKAPHLGDTKHGKQTVKKGNDLRTK